MKSGLKEFANITLPSSNSVATYAAMKSGLKELMSIHAQWKTTM